MSKKTLVQVGQIVEIKEPLTLYAALSGAEMIIPAGARAFITQNGFAHFISPGKVSGKMIMLEKLADGFALDNEVNTEHIPAEIGRRLANDFEMEDDEREEAISTIEGVLETVFF